MHVSAVNGFGKILLNLLLLLSFPLPAQQPLKISPNKRFLMKEDGTPFFYLGDTAWELFHRLNQIDTDTYLSNRVSKGFTVIQAVLLSEIDGLTEPNANGDVPLLDRNPLQPNEPYFKHVDWVMDRAQSYGLYMAVLPTWGAWAIKENHPLFPSYQIFTPANAREYGRFLGKRYKN